MNRDKWLIGVSVMLLVASTAAVLARLQSGHQLGAPGLKMVDRKVFGPEAMVVNTNTIDLPLRVLNFTSEQLEVTADELKWLPKDTTYGRRHYRTQIPRPFEIQVSVVLMGTDRTSIHKPQFCLEGQGWNIEKSELTRVRVMQPHPYDLPIMKLTAGKTFRAGTSNVEKRAIFIYWFVADNRLTAKHGERMWWMATDLLRTGVLPRWAYVTYWSICDVGQEETTFEIMKQFIAASVPEFQLVTGPAAREETVAGTK